LRSERTELRREILDATRGLLLQEGIRRLSMRKIASQIGCKAPSIYYHFSNKAALIRALVVEGHQILFTAMEGALSRCEDPLARMAAYIRTYVRFGLENSEYYEMMFMISHREAGLDARESFRLAKPSRELAVSAFREALAAGLVREPDVHQAISATGIMMHGYLTLAIRHGEDTPFDRETMLEFLVSSAFRSYGASALIGEG